MHVCFRLRTPRTISLQQYPVGKQKTIIFFLVGIAESRGRELGRRRGDEGWETHTVRFIFRKQPGWICKSCSCFLKMRFSLRSPTPDTPVPSFQPSSLHHQQAGEGAVAWQWSQFAWINSTIIFINLKAQGAGEDWRKLAFPLVSL